MQIVGSIRAGIALCNSLYENIFPSNLEVEIKLINRLLEACNTFRVNQHKNLSEIDVKLYHYTNILALKDILQNRKIWLTKADYMNDSQEVVYATEKISRIFMETFDYRSKCYNQVMNKIIIPNRFNKRAFIVSLSRDHDSLPLWSNYAHMEGYNLAFRSDRLYHATQESVENMIKSKSSETCKVVCGKDYNIIIDDIIYNKEIQDDIVMEIINKMELVMSFYRKSDISAHQTNKLLESLAKRLQIYIVLFKQQSFKAEKESRMIITIEDTNVLDNMIRHRISNGAFVPYIEIDLKLKIDSSPFKGITIGPRNNSDLAAKGMKSFLLKNDYIVNDNDIIKSCIPLRY